MDLHKFTLITQMVQSPTRKLKYIYNKQTISELRALHVIILLESAILAHAITNHSHFKTITTQHQLMHSLNQMFWA